MKIVSLQFRHSRSTHQEAAAMETPKQEAFEPTTDLGAPVYWLSYEYKQMQAEMKKLNDKMDLILSLQKKPKKSTISEVDRKVDSLINIVKKRKIEE